MEHEMVSNKPKIFYNSFAPQEIYDLLETAASDEFDIITLSADDDDERYRKIAECDGVIVAGYKLTDAHINAAEKLKVVQHQGVGWHDTTDWQTLKARQIRLAINLAGSTVSVAEHTILLILAASKHAVFADNQIREGRWLVNELRMQSRELSQMKVGLLGMGRIGSLVATRLASFGCEVSYCDPYVTKDDAFTAQYKVKKVSFDELIEENDVLSLHLPRMESTRNIISADVIQRMKAGAIFINAARGGLVDELALDKALREGRLTSAGLDVFDFEPINADNPLLTNPKAVLSPHIAAGTKDALEQKIASVIHNLKQYFEAGTLDNEVDLQAHQD